MDIAFEYAQLCEEEEVNIYQIILHEWQLTKDIILMIEEQDELLAENPIWKKVWTIDAILLTSWTIFS